MWYVGSSSGGLFGPAVSDRLVIFVATALLSAGCAAKINQPTGATIPTLATEAGSSSSSSSSSSSGATQAPVSFALAIVPAQISVAALSNFTFSSVGGTPPYAYSLVSGGGSVVASYGKFTAPASVGTCVVRVTDSVGSHQDSTVTVYPALTISPASAVLAYGQTQAFVGAGGAGSYTYSVASGLGSINSTSGLYTASTGPGSAIVQVTDGAGNNQQALITISGSNPISTATFGAASASANESAGTQYAQLNFSPALSEAVSINFAIGGTAVGAGTNYTLTSAGTTLGASGILDIPAGTTQTTFAIAMVNHSLATPATPSATVSITLTGFNNVNAGAITAYTLTMLNSDIIPTATFAAGSAASALTSAGTVPLAVTLSQAWTQNVSVNYSVTGGTAVGGGVDYTLGSGTLTFTPGTTSQNIPLALTSTALVAPTKTIVISLSGYVQATAGLNPTLTFSILNNNSYDLYLSGTGGSTIGGAAITSCGGGSSCSAANPYVISANTTFSSVTLVNNAVLTAPAYTAGPAAPGNGQLVLTVTGNVAIAAGSTILMDSKGYLGNTGTGVGGNASNWGAGGGYGGQGGYGSGMVPSTTYGSLTNPTDIGSGGGEGGCCAGGGGAGGGAIILTISGTLSLNGTISANGQAGPSQSGGGAGGSINLTTAVVSGSTGVLSVEGGNSPNTSAGSGGGGGRIALNYATDGYTGGVTALSALTYGGANALQPGGSGTFFLFHQGVSTNGTLLANNGNLLGATTPLLSPSTFDVLTLENAANLEVPSGQTLTYATGNFSGNPTITNYGTIATPFSTIPAVSLVNFGTISIPGGNLTIGNGGSLVWGLNTLTLNSLDVQPGGTLTHVPNSSLPTYDLLLTVTGNLTVESGGAINVDGKGYTPGNGSGAGTGCSGGEGGGYGGIGGNNGCTAGGIAYGSIQNPTALGSAGWSWSGNGGAGGGYANITASTLTLNGSISSNGLAGTGNSGGGSGGSINITTTTITGQTGHISANGGTAAPSGGPGAGGRISVTYTNDSFTGGFPTLPQTAFSGAGGNPGGAGTIYSMHAGTDTFGSLVVNDNGFSGITPIIANTTLDGFTIAAATNLEIATGIALQSSSTSIQPGGILTNYGSYLNSTSTLSGMTLYNFGTLTIPGNNLTIGANGTLVVGTPTMTLNTLTIQNGGILTHQANTSTQTYALNLSAATVTINAGGLIDLDGKGFGAGYGSGAGLQGSGCSGAGYGGQGGNNGTVAGGTGYGSATDPTYLGSGGCSWSGTGGAGGGSLQLAVSGTLTLNGSITSNGLTGTGNSGGGSGGSINITANTVTGSSGTLIAGGGQAASGGSAGTGGGGRIALTYVNDTYSGTVSAIPMTAFGGSNGPQPGGAGSIFLMHTGVDTNGRLIVANNNESGCAPTTLFGTDTFDSLTVSGDANLEVESGASLTSTSVNFQTGTTLTNYGTYNNPVSTIDGINVVNGGTLNIPGGNLTIASGTFTVTNSTLSLNSLDIQSGAVLTHLPNAGTQVNSLTLDISDNLNLESGGMIDVDGLGFTAGSGPGVGQQGNGCSGAGYGGRGGGDGTVAGGTFYGSLVNPVDIGSAGCSWSGIGGTGGGLARITVGNTFTLNGIITANGLAGTGNSGGGSGGGVYISTLAITGGAGVVRANGGAAVQASAGSGSGGRIAIYYTTDTTTSGVAEMALSAYGGTGGAQAGAAGTIFTSHTGTDSFGRLWLNNADGVGPTTPVNANYTFDQATILNAASLEIRPGITYTATSESFSANASIVNYGTYVSGSSALNAHTVTNYDSLQFPSNDLTIGSGGKLIDGSDNLTLNNIEIESGGVLTHPPNSTLQTYWLQLTAANLTIDSGGTIDLDGMGFAAQTGTGAGGYNSTAGSGAGHGGVGGASEFLGSGGATYGIAGDPAELGSGGGNSNCGTDGGAGGGYAILDITGTLTINGTITANGLAGGCRGGGGSGGSISIATQILAGTSGALEANGGGVTNAAAGPGGGGRIFTQINTNDFAGLTKQANGGVGGTYGNGAIGSVSP